MQLAPSLQGGYARSAGEAEFPGLWRSLALWADFSLGNQGLSVINHAPGGGTGTPTGATAPAMWAGGAAGHSVVTDGSASYVDFGDNSRYFFSGAFSVALQFLATGSAGTNRYLYADYNSGGSLSSFGGRVTSADVCTFFWENPNLTNNLLTGTTTISTGRWYWYHATWDGVDTRRLYINGVQDATNTAAQTRTDVGGSTAIGRPGSLSFQYGPFRFKHFGLWGRQLDPSEIADMAMRGCTPLVQRDFSRARYLPPTSPPPPPATTPTFVFATGFGW